MIAANFGFECFGCALDAKLFLIRINFKNHNINNIKSVGRISLINTWFSLIKNMFDIFENQNLKKSSSEQSILE